MFTSIRLGARAISSASLIRMTAQQHQGRETRSRAIKRARDEHTLDTVSQKLQTFIQEAPRHRPVSNKLAAVLVPLFSSPDNAGEVRVLLTQRSASLLKHQGEVCLPGGKRDPEDADDVATAVREANEELGLNPNDVQVLGCLEPMLSKHYLSVTPVAAIIPHERSKHAPTPNADEVAEVFDVPLSLFLSRKGHTSQDITWREHQYRIHSFQYEGHTIWGLTAAILIRVAKVAFGSDPEFKEHAPKGTEYTKFWYDGQQLQVHTLALGGSGVEEKEEAATHKKDNEGPATPVTIPLDIGRTNSHL